MLVLPIGTMCIVNKPTSTKVYRVKQHFPPGTRKKYKKENSQWETQVQCILNLSLHPEVNTKPKKSSGLTTFDPIWLQPLNLVSLGVLRSKLDSVLRDLIR